MKTQILLVFFAACIAALAPTGVANAKAMECSVARPSSAQGYWSWRLIDGRKCWYAGKTVTPKSALRWPAAEPAQAKVKVAPPVSIVAEKRSDPMNAQARTLDDDSFESRWRARVSTE